MPYRAWKGPAGSLSGLVGYLGGVTRVTDSHVDGLMPTWIDPNTITFTDSPMDITVGGTYTGLRISAPDGVNCINIRTGDTVIFEDCIFSHTNGRGIYAPGGLATGYGSDPKVEVYNSAFLGVHPSIEGERVGHAINYGAGSRLIVENCHFQRGGIYGYQHRAELDDVLRVRYNVALNIDARLVDASGVPTNTVTALRQFFQHNGRTNIAGAFEVAWNEVWNEPDDSACEDAINLYNTGGTSTNLLHVHHNLINGAYPTDPTVSNYSGGGIMLSDSGSLNDPAYGLAEYNVVLASANYGMAITAGNHFTIDNNRVFRTGTWPDGVTDGQANTGPGIYVYDYGPSTAFGDHTVTNNTYRWQNYPTGTNNTWFSSPGANFTNSGNTAYDTTIDQDFIDAEIVAFRQGAEDAGITIGSSLAPTTAPTNVNVSPSSTSVALVGYMASVTGGTSSASIDTLLVVGSLTLNTSEGQIETRLEGQGHTVTVTTDALLATPGNPYPNDYDLVIMSKTVVSTTVGTKLRVSTAPVLFWEDNQQQGVEATMLATIDASGVTGTAWHGTNDTIYVNASAPAAQRANLSGTTTFYTQSGEITFAPVEDDGTTETLIAGATRIAEYVNSGNGRWVIYAVEQGATLSDSTTAPARRVFFGLYDDTFRYLTADGLALWDAQVEWLAGTVGASGTVNAGVGAASIAGLTPIVNGAAPGELLYVLPTASSPDANDTAFINLFGANGWNVTQHSTASDEAIPVDMSPYDVVFISETNLSSNILAKWNAVTQGIVTAENGAWDEMNLASGATTLTATTTLTIVGGHAIAAGYSGDTAILSSAAQMRIGATLGSGVTSIAHQVGTSTNEVIFAYESGASLLNAATAAGRRVAIGLHSDTMQVLATPGEEILLAALDWAAGATTAASIDVRATDVAYAQTTSPTSFGADWDKSFPVETTAVERVVGFRFQMNIPQGATITSATFTAYSGQNATWVSGTDDRTFGAEQVDNSVSATTAGEADTKSANLGTTHTWSNSGAVLTGDPIATGSISAIIQQIVNRAGWVSGNYVTLWSVHPGNGSASHQLWSVGSPADPSDYPRLEVGYES